MSWEKTTIGEHCTVTSSKRFHLSERSSYGIPFYCSKEIIQKHRGEEITSCDYIKESFYNKIIEKFGVPNTNDLLITTRGTLGIPYLYKENDKFYFADGNLTWLKSFKCTLSPKYLYYWFLSDEGHHKILSISKGTAQKAIPIIGIKNLEIFLPDIVTQNHIASILSAYDDLIENNQKQIKLLEEAAQRLYKEWFVDLRFPGWENTKIVDGVPEGWTVTTLDDVIDFDPKVPLSKDRIKQFIPMSALSTNSMCLNLNEITFTQSNSGSKFQNGDTLLARITPCLENGKTAFVSGIISDEGAVGSTEYIVMRSKKLNPYMVYLLARTNDFRQAAINSMSGSDGRQRAKVDKLKCLPYLLPLDNIIQKSLDLFEPIFSNIESLSIQSQRLDEIKNMLLPKLMNDRAGIL